MRDWIKPGFTKYPEGVVMNLLIKAYGIYKCKTLALASAFILRACELNVVKYQYIEFVEEYQL